MTITDQVNAAARFAARRGGSSRTGAGRRLMQWIKRRRERSLQRRSQHQAIQALRRLDGHILKDIGMDRTEIESAVIFGRHGLKRRISSAAAPVASDQTLLPQSRIDGVSE